MLHRKFVPKDLHYRMHSNPLSSSSPSPSPPPSPPPSPSPLLTLPHSFLSASLSPFLLPPPPSPSISHHSSSLSILSPPAPTSYPFTPPHFLLSPPPPPPPSPLHSSLTLSSFPGDLSSAVSASSSTATLHAV